MSPNELQINNWVKNGDTILRVTVRALELFTTKKVTLSSIKLTPKIISSIKGFTKTEHEDSFWIPIDNDKALIVEFTDGKVRVGISTAAKTRSDFWGPVFTDVVKELHHLQNFYFLLTGKQLEMDWTG